VKVLVTGGGGFIGAHLVRRLADDGHDLVVLDSLEGQVHDDHAPPTFPQGVRFVHGNVGDPIAAAESLAGVDAVVHLAALVGVGQSMYEIDRYVRGNTLATATFLETMVELPERPRRLVVASSMSIYGEGEYECPNHGRVAPQPRTEEQLLERDWECHCPECSTVLAPVGTRETKPLIPTSVYAITKRDHEELCLVAGRAYDIPTVALRFFNVYGPGQALSNPYTGVVAIFASRLLGGKPAVIFEDGLQSRDFVHVHDIVDGIMRALDSEAANGQVINVGTGRPATIDDVAAALSRGLGVDIEPDRLGRHRAGDIRHCYADVGLAERLLGFQASVQLEQGMADLIPWLSDKQAVDRVDQATSELLARRLAR
jgi:dTDP-L-rhamnose 4-epimerase